MSIFIKTIPKTLLINKKGVFCKGQITLNDFNETFEMPLTWWGIEMYQQQWQEGLNRLQSYDRSCLITSILNPYKAPFLEWWLLYKKENKVYVYNEVLFEQSYEEIIGNKIISLETCYDFVPLTKIKSELPEGLQESEWIIDFKK